MTAHCHCRPLTSGPALIPLSPPSPTRPSGLPLPRNVHPTPHLPPTTTSQSTLCQQHRARQRRCAVCDAPRGAVPGVPVGRRTERGRRRQAGPDQLQRGVPRRQGRHRHEERYVRHSLRPLHLHLLARPPRLAWLPCGAAELCLAVSPCAPHRGAQPVMMTPPSRPPVPPSCSVVPSVGQDNRAAVLLSGVASGGRKGGREGGGFTPRACSRR